MAADDIILGQYLNKVNTWIIIIIMSQRNKILGTKAQIILSASFRVK